MTRRILFADNHTKFRDQRAADLREHGYDVLTAASVTEAERLLRDEIVHLAILDIRLTNDADPNDVSGLVLARKADYRAIPKVMLTLYPRVEDVREALRSGTDDGAPAVDYLAKHDGPAVMLAMVDAAFDKHVKVNWALQFDGERQGLSFAQLAALIDEQANGTRVIELEELFRRLFPIEQQLRLDRVLWHRGGRVAVAVFVFAKDSTLQSVLVICGAPHVIREEERRFEEYKPKAPSVDATVFHRSAATLHFAARSYVVSGWELDRASSLRDLYRSGTERTFNAVLASLFARTLHDWSQPGRAVATEPLEQCFRRRLRLQTEDVDEQAFAVRIDALLRQSSALDLRLERSDGTLRVIDRGRTVEYPDPCRSLRADVLGNQVMALAVSPGWVSGDSVLTDRESRAWLTDVGEAGLAPINWDFVTLEADLRFEWTDTDDLQLIHEFETALAAAGFGRLEATQVDASLRRLLRAIQAIRKLAPQSARDASQHHAGLLLHAIRRLADFDPAARLLPSELNRLVHVLLAAAILLKQVLDTAVRSAPTAVRSAPTASGAPGASGPSGAARKRLVVDTARGIVTIDGREATMPRQSYELLSYLYGHVNELCSRREIFEHVFRMPFDENDDSHVGRLSTAVRRLRERIEPDLDRPTHLLTESGRGYRLVC